MGENVCEDVDGVYANPFGSVNVCLDELVVDGPLQIASVAEASMWDEIPISDHYQRMESKMWTHVSDYSSYGQKLIDLVRGNSWFQGWDGLPLGCKVKGCTRVALQSSSPVSVVDTCQIFVYLDGSSLCNDEGPLMTWGFCCFNVDKDDNHNLIYSSGGIVDTDEASHLFFRSG